MRQAPSPQFKTTKTGPFNIIEDLFLTYFPRPPFDPNSNMNFGKVAPMAIRNEQDCMPLSIHPCYRSDYKGQASSRLQRSADVKLQQSGLLRSLLNPFWVTGRRHSPVARGLLTRNVNVGFGQSGTSLHLNGNCRQKRC